jgi:hypothetical protein
MLHLTIEGETCQQCFPSWASEEMESGQVVESDLPHSEDDVVEPIQFQPAGVGSE